MAYQALYRKWRPSTFDDVVGQTHVVTTLKNEIKADKTAHAYLFCGTRGTGKTSCAKIFARAINCQNPQNGNPCNQCEICKGVLDGSILDITEIDAASNNGVDNIREIRDEVVYSAAQAKYKIYIIDEVHMLSTGAFNALLKTLEEPPPHVVFILATTEAHKLPATITSRCQRFDFRRISIKDIVIRLKEITTAEDIDVQQESLELIARLADGALRDAVSILDQCVSAFDGKLTLDKATDILGVATDTLLDTITESIANKDIPKTLECINTLQASGKDIPNFIDVLTGRFRDIMICAVSKNSTELFEYSSHTVDEIKRQAKMFSPEEISYILKTLCEASVEAKWSKNVRTIYEVALIRLCDSRLNTSLDALVARIAQLEQQILSGADANKSASPTQTPTQTIIQRPSPPTVPIPVQSPAPKPIQSPDPNPEDGLLDSPPWETEAQTMSKQIPVIEEKQSAPKSAPPQEQIPKPAPEPKPTPNISQTQPVGNAVQASASMWAEVLNILKKSSVALYGALSVKKAKLTQNKLYLPNEEYLKAILTALSKPLMEAIKTVTGNEVTVSFVPLAELESIAETTVAQPLQVTQVKYAPPIQPITLEVAPQLEPHDTDADEAADMAGAEDPDPLDALFRIDGLNITQED